MRRLILSSVGVVVGLTALVGFAHTKAGRPLLALLGKKSAKKGGCPLGFDVSQSPDEKEAGRRSFAVAHRGDGVARERPALGFTLDQTTREEVKAWAAAHGVACTKPRSGADLDCSNVAADLLPAPFAGAAVRSLWFNFGAGDRLISVIAVRHNRSAATISSTFGAVALEITKAAGAPARVDGDGSPARLAGGLLAQASVEYRFRNYYALARATNLGYGFVLTEEYRSLPN